DLRPRLLRPRDTGEQRGGRLRGLSPEEDRRGASAPSAPDSTRTGLSAGGTRMSRRWSLRRRLVGSVLAVVALALGTLAALLYLTLRETLRERFDEDLAEDARAIAAHVEEGPGGRWEVEDDADGHELPEGLWYRLRSSDGADLGGSQRLPGPEVTGG